VALVRAASTGTLTVASLGHAAVLLAVSTVALLVAARRVDRLLRR
jgi:hypothetical protein